MESAFVIGGITTAHVTDRVTLATEPEGESYDVLTEDGTESVVDVRGVWLTLALDVAAPDGLGGALGGEGTPDHALWLAILTATAAGQTVSYLPDTSAPAVSVEVVPDVRHAPPVYAVRGGMLVPGIALRLRSRRMLTPTDEVLRALSRASPYARLARGFYSIEEDGLGAHEGATLTLVGTQSVGLRSGREVAVDSVELGLPETVRRDTRRAGSLVEITTRTAPL